MVSGATDWGLGSGLIDWGLGSGANILGDGIHTKDTCMGWG